MAQRPEAQTFQATALVSPPCACNSHDEVKKTEPAAVVGGVNVHAGVAFDGRDKARLERLCRYLARPPIAQDRLTLREDGSVQYTMLCL